MFLRHEGFLGALGAFMSYEKHGLDDLMAHQLVERFPMGAPYVGGKIHGPPLGDLNEKVRIVVEVPCLCYGFFIKLLLDFLNLQVHTSNVQAYVLLSHFIILLDTVWNIIVSSHFNCSDWKGPFIIYYLKIEGSYFTWSNSVCA